MIEFGRAVMVQQILTNASREGARTAVLDGSTSSQVTTSVGTYLQNVNISGATVSVVDSNGASVEPSTLGYGAPVTVKVQVPFSSVSWLPAPWFLGGTQLTATTVMRRETVQ